MRIGWSPDCGIGVPVERAVLQALEAQPGVFEELGAAVEEASIDLREADRVFGATRAMHFAASSAPRHRWSPSGGLLAGGEPP